MSVEERHLLNKIRFFEDMLLRGRDCRQQERIGGGYWLSCVFGYRNYGLAK